MNVLRKILVVLVTVAFCLPVRPQLTPVEKTVKKTVAQDGSGDYTTIQAAINDAKAFPYGRITIFIKNGRYYEKIKVHEWNPNLSLVGESREKTIITYDDHFRKINLGSNSTFYTPTVMVDSEGFMASNLTIENSSGEVGQAIALSILADKTAIINCNIIGNQDTLYLSGNDCKSYFKDCFIQGTTDFIFGNGTAFFENCTLHSLKDSYITAASTPQGIAYGFVFNNCHLTSASGINRVYLGRPWRIYAKTVFINTKMESHIVPEGWHNWSKPEAEANSCYAEYNCTGAGYKPNKRVLWAHQLTAGQAKQYTVENCLGADFVKAIKLWEESK